MKRATVIYSLLVVLKGGQNMRCPPLPNMPFWNMDYFKLKAIEKQKLQEEFSALPLSI